MSMLSRRIFIQDGFKVVSLGLAMPHIFTRAVRAFQRATGLVEDGILGPRTTLALSRVVASALAPSIGTALTR